MGIPIFHVEKKWNEGVFISCTNFRTIKIFQRLERDLNKPVVNSDSATMLKLLKLADVHGPIEGYGQLLTGYR